MGAEGCGSQFDNLGGNLREEEKEEKKEEAEVGVRHHGER